MNSTPMLRFVIAGQPHRDYILTNRGKANLDILGGNVFYAGVGAALWENGIGLLGRVGEDYPQSWLAALEQRGFDTRGIHILPQSIDVRYFVAYTEQETKNQDNPVSHFARLGLPFPRLLLDYSGPSYQLDSRTQPNLFTIRLNDIPPDYLDATAAHICPMDFLSQSLLPATLRQGHINTLTLDPGPMYMDPAFWDDIPGIVQGLTAFICAEEKLINLFQGRTSDLWAMAETLAGYGCELIVIKRGSRGQWLYDHSTHSRWTIPAYPAHVEDPTGAGDAFCGGFLAGYRSTYDPLMAALYGNISASLVIEGTGPLYALDSLPGLAQARLYSLKDMVRRA